MNDDKRESAPAAVQPFNLRRNGHASRGPPEIIVIDDTDEEDDATKNPPSRAEDSESDEDENEKGGATADGALRGAGSRPLARSTSMDSLGDRRASLRASAAAASARRSLPLRREPHSGASAAARNASVPAGAGAARAQRAPIGPTAKKSTDRASAAVQILVRQQQQLQEGARSKPKAAAPTNKSRTTPPNLNLDERLAKRLRSEAPSTPIEKSPRLPSAAAPVRQAPSAAASAHQAPNAGAAQAPAQGRPPPAAAGDATPGGAPASTTAVRQQPSKVECTQVACVPATPSGGGGTQIRAIFAAFRPQRFDFPLATSAAIRFSPFVHLAVDMGYDRAQGCAICGSFEHVDFECARCKLGFHRSCLRGKDQWAGPAAGYCRACAYVTRPDFEPPPPPEDVWRKLRADAAEGNPIDLVLPPAYFEAYVGAFKADWLRCAACKKRRVVAQGALSECVNAPFRCTDAYWFEVISCQTGTNATDANVLNQVEARAAKRMHRRAQLFAKLGAKHKALFERKQLAKTDPTAIIAPAPNAAPSRAPAQPPPAPPSVNTDDTPETWVSPARRALMNSAALQRAPRPNANGRDALVGNAPTPRPNVAPPALNAVATPALVQPSPPLPVPQRNVFRQAPAAQPPPVRQYAAVPQRSPAPVRTNVALPPTSSRAATVPNHQHVFHHATAVQRAAMAAAQAVANRRPVSQAAPAPRPNGASHAPASALRSNGVSHAPTAARAAPAVSANVQAHAATSQTTLPPAGPPRRNDEYSDDKFKSDLFKLIGRHQSEVGDLVDVLVDMIRSKHPGLIELYRGCGEFEDLLLNQVKREARKELQKRLPGQNQVAASRERVVAQHQGPEIQEVPVQGAPKPTAHHLAYSTRHQVCERFRALRMRQIQEDVALSRNMMEELRRARIDDIPGAHANHVLRKKALASQHSDQVREMVPPKRRPTPTVAPT